MRRRITPARTALAGLVLLALVAAILVFTPSERYIFLPDEAHSVAPRVVVEGERPDPDGGGIFYVNVIVRKATLLERLVPGLQEGSTLVEEHVIRPPGVSEADRRRADRNAMSQSQKVAAAVALRALGRNVRTRSTGVLVSGVFPETPAAGKLRQSEIIVAIDGEPVRTVADLRRLIGRRKPGEPVRLRIRSSEGLRAVELKTIADPDRPGRPVIGISPDQAAEIELPLAVKIDLGDVGGPSAGLAFALDLMEELGRRIDRGYKVAATGAIELDGTVLPIGGVKQKTIGARRSRVDIFLVPAGENARDARRYAEGLRVVPVKNFQQALRALATLPPKARAD